MGPLWTHLFANQADRQRNTDIYREIQIRQTHSRRTGAANYKNNAVIGWTETPPRRPLNAVPNVTIQPSRASVPTSLLSVHHKCAGNCRQYTEEFFAIH